MKFVGQIGIIVLDYFIGLLAYQIWSL